jgi:glycosyltransferase involved in cell wall biosynthesis
LIQACRPFLIEKNGVRLTYIGDGTLLDALKQKALETGAAERVSFLGRLSHSAVVDNLRSCDLLVVPTRQELGEGRPKTVIEGLIMGCCLLVPDYGAFRYLVKNGVNGMMYRPEDIADMERKIRHLVENSSIREALGRDAAISSHELRQPPKTFYQALENIIRLLP